MVEPPAVMVREVGVAESEKFGAGWLPGQASGAFATQKSLKCICSSRKTELSNRLR